MQECQFSTCTATLYGTYCGSSTVTQKIGMKITFTEEISIISTKSSISMMLCADDKDDTALQVCNYGL